LDEFLTTGRGDVASPQNLFLAFICSGFFLVQEIEGETEERREGKKVIKSFRVF